MKDAQTAQAQKLRAGSVELLVHVQRLCLLPL